MSDNSGIKRTCQSCGAALRGDEGPYCSQCQIARDEEAMDEIQAAKEEEHPDLPETEKSRTGLVIKVMLLCACVVVIAFQLPRVITSIEGDQPIRKGTYETDALTDECIENLWKISRMLEEGKLPDDSLVCPESGEPYTVYQDANNPTVVCPNPKAHGLIQLRVSRMFPCPEVVE